MMVILQFQTIFVLLACDDFHENVKDNINREKLPGLTCKSNGMTNKQDLEGKFSLNVCIFSKSWMAPKMAAKSIES